MKHGIPLAMFAALTAAPATVVAAETDQQDHEAMRALLATFAQAFNTRQIDALLPHLHRNFTVTMVKQDVVTNPSELKGYLDKQFSGPGALLKDVQIKPEGDDRTVFLEGRIGINRGSSVDTYTLADGRVITLKTRWTGTAIQEGDQWKVLTAHIGLNILDNPILEGMEKLRWTWTAGGVFAGLIAGFLAGRLLRRR